ncbi:MAG: hypothetical protein JJU02_04120 [Cryomorphaceae bacterium]|nr:hypothetical protein [Cryomorphaceae bacterium]
MTVKTQKRIRYGMYFFIPILVVLLIPVKIPYSVKTRAAMHPMQEWQLKKTTEGNLVYIYKDNRKGTLETYGLTEFQRGDVVTFSLTEGLLRQNYIEKGDTIGHFISNEEQRKYIELSGQLEVLKAELEFYTTGQKPEDVDEAQHKLRLARQELKTERKLMERSSILHRDSVISDQEFEIAENRLRVKEIDLDIAEARYRSITTGEKPEQELLLRSKILATEQQLEQVKDRLAQLTLRSPISGMVIHQHSGSDNRIMAIADTSNIISLCAAKSHYQGQIFPGQTAYTTLGGKIYEGKVIAVDNSMQFINGHSAFFVRVAFPGGELPPGAVLDVDIYLEDLRFFSYLGKIFGVN